MSENKIYILKNDLDKIVFCGNKSAIYDFLVAGQNYLLSSFYDMFDFNMQHIKTFITRR